MPSYNPVINSGNHTRLIKAMDKARRGEDLCIAFIGGSITEGYSSTSHDKCYAKLIHDWWVRKFKGSNISYVNAGIGGTGSDYGAARVEGDVLKYKPDVVFVDFTVNDADNEFYAETYEGLLRRIIKSSSHPAVVLLFFVQYDSGISAQPHHLEIGRHYDLPCISCVSSIYAKLKDGLIKAGDFTQDMLHPNDRGHAMIAAMAADFLDTIKHEAAAEEAEGPLPAPLGINAWENVKRLQNAGTDAVLKGFEKDTKEKEYPADHFRGGWSGKKAGDEVIFKLNCSEISVQLRRTVKRPAPVALAVVDGDEDNAVMLDANFDQDWGDCLSVIPVMRHGCVVTGQTKKDCSPAKYEHSAEALAKYKDTEPQAKEHELKIRIIGTPGELGYTAGEMISGGPAWHKSEGNDEQAGFELLSVFTA